MTKPAPDNQPSPTDRTGRRTGWGLVWLSLVLGAILMGWLPNPASRLYEIDAGMYRTLHAVLDASNSPRLEQALKNALTQDGKLTQANMEQIWPVYMAAIPHGFRIPVPGAERRSTELQELIERVGAQPTRSVFTLNAEWNLRKQP